MPRSCNRPRRWRFFVLPLSVPPFQCPTPGFSVLLWFLLCLFAAGCVLQLQFVSSKVQHKTWTTPSIFHKKAYGGMSSSSGGILGMLEVIHSDFSRLEADTSASEAQSQMEFEQFVADAKDDLEKKHREEVDKRVSGLSMIIPALGRRILDWDRFPWSLDLKRVG